MMIKQSNTIRANACAVAVGLLFGAALAQGATLSKFTGGDLGEGLDLKNDAGGFVYALDFRLSGGTTNLIQDATFLPTSTNSPPPGVTLVHYTSPNNTLTALGFPGPFNFGATANDAALAAVMDGTAQIGLSPNDFAVNLAVTAGKTYKLQLLMLGTGGAHRPANYTIDGAGTTFIDIPSDANSYPNSAYVVTETFVAPSSLEHIVITWTGAGGSNASFIHGLTLELIPEPTAVGLFGLGLGGLLLLRRRR